MPRRYSNYTNTAAATPQAEATKGYRILLRNMNDLLIDDLGSTSEGNCLVSECTITEKLYDPDEISLKIPRQFLTSIGEPFYKHNHIQLEAIIEIVREADNKSFKYRIKSKDDNLETEVTCEGKSLSVELAEHFTNESSGGSIWHGYKPSVFINKILAGYRPIAIKNPRFGILDASNLPTNWSHPAYWDSGMGSDGIRYWRTNASSRISVSDKIIITPLKTYRFECTLYGTAGMHGSGFFGVYNYYSDGDYDSHAAYRVFDGTNSATADSTLIIETSFPSDTVNIELQLGGSLIDSYIYFKQVKVLELGTNTGWTYTAVPDGNGDSMDSRKVNIYANDSVLTYSPGIQWTGSIPLNYWNGVGYNFNTPSASYVRCSTSGSTIEANLITPYVYCNFKGTGSTNSKANIYVNETLRASNISVSADINYYISGLDLDIDNIITVEVAGGEVHFIGFTVNADNLVSFQFYEETLLNVMASLIEAIGGEVEYDTATKTIKHYKVRGTDWITTTGGPTFIRESNLPQLTLKNESTEITNRLIFEGYGDAEKLLITVDSDELDSSGQRSQDLYGIRRGKYTDKKVRDLAIAYRQAREIVNQNCWGKTQYETSVFDDSVRTGVLKIGDTARFIYNDQDINLRIIEMRKDIFNPRYASLTIGDQIDSMAKKAAKVEKQLRGLASTPQGNLNLQTLSFNDPFDTTYPMEFEFDIFYKENIGQLLLSYKVAGMRSTTSGTDASSQTVGTTDPGGGGNVTNSSSVDTAGGGSHNHEVAKRSSGAYVPGNGEFNMWIADNKKGGFYFQTWGGTMVPVNDIWYTYGIGDHTHPMNHYHTISTHYHYVTIPTHNHPSIYKIRESSIPSTIRVYLDDNLISEAVGIMATNLDVKQYIQMDSNGYPSEGVHTLKFELPTGQNSSTAHVRGRLFKVSYITNKLE